MTFSRLKSFEEIREEFPALKKWYYFDTAATGLMPRRAAEAINAWLEDHLLNSEVSYSSWLREVERVRGKIAELINASPREIAFVKNTSEGLSFIASGLDLKRDDNVVLNDLEFPANVYPWINRARVKFVKSRDGKVLIDDIERAIDEKTKVVAISSVQFSTGFRAELEELGKLCKERGIHFVVDGIQSIGALDLDVKRCQIDFLACGSHKWLMGPPGIGFLYVSNGMIGKLKVPEVGWKSVKEPFNFNEYRLEFDETARRFECGSLPFPLIYGLGASLDLIKDIGIHRVERRVLRLTELLINGLVRLNVEIISPLEEKYRSGIISFKVRNQEKLLEGLRKNRIIASIRKGIRISAHLYNDENDIEVLLKVLRNAIG